MNWQEIIGQLRGSSYQFGVIGSDSLIKFPISQKPSDLF